MESFKGRELSVQKVLDHLRGMTEARVYSRAVSIRRAFNYLLEKAPSKGGTVEGRQYYSISDVGLDEANELYHEYIDEVEGLEKRYGGDWRTSL